MVRSLPRGGFSSYGRMKLKNEIDSARGFRVFVRADEGEVAGGSFLLLDIIYISRKGEYMVLYTKVDEMRWKIMLILDAASALGIAIENVDTTRDTRQ